MAKIIEIDIKDKNSYLKDIFFKGLQSCNVNFLVGSGCSIDAIPYDNKIEKLLTDLLNKSEYEEAEKEKYKFLKDIIEVNEELLKKTISDKTEQVLMKYKKFISIINHILSERKNNILHKQANIFSTNYDLFIERASADLGNIYLNDGFRRNTNLNSEYIFSSKEFYNYTCHSGSLYGYKVDLPSINLIKIHGSLSWNIKKISDKIIFSTNFVKLDDEDDILKIKEFNNQVSIIFPDIVKHQDTVLNHNYYDLMRIFSHELDKENTILFICGFGFNDIHIQEIIERALGNPTLNVFIFAYSKDDVIKFKNIFEKFNNVSVISLKDEMLSFGIIIDLIDSIFSYKEI